MTTPEFTIRTATADDYELSATIFTGAMLFDFTPSPTGRAKFEPQRTLIAEVDGAAAGSARAISRDMSVPGNVVPVAHVSGVGVGQTYRRRGVLSGLMHRQLREVPEAVAALWASETGIYGRYGYARAAGELRITAKLDRTKLLPGPAGTGRLRPIQAETAAALLDPVLAEFQRQRPGVSNRRPADWADLLEDPAEHRHGASQRRIVVHEDEHGRIGGYLFWRSRMDFDADGANGTAEVEEVVATTPEAHRALWSHLLTMDLCRTLTYMHAATDDPLLQLAADTRALRTRFADTLWLRITDVPRALSQRRYGAPIDLVIEVADDLIASNNGRFHLTGDAEKARCEATEAPADVSLTVNELAGIYLGTRSPVEFLPSGRITEHTPGALFAASAGFGWPIAPAAIEIF